MSSDGTALNCCFKYEFNLDWNLKYAKLDGVPEKSVKTSK